MVYVKDKEKEIQKIVPQLKAKQSFIQSKQDAEMYEGMNGIITLLNILIEDAKKGDEFLFFPAETESQEKNREIQDFYARYDAKRNEKGLIVKGIANANTRHLFENRKILKMKYSDLPIPANIGICNRWEF